MKTIPLLFAGALALDFLAMPAWAAQVEPVDPSKAPGADSTTVLLLHFNESSGEIAKDDSQQNNHGKIGGKAEWVPGVFGKALRFNGKDQYVDCGGERKQPPDFDLGESTDFTIEFWVNTSTKNRYAHLVNKKCNPAAEEPGFMIFLHLGKAKAIFADGQNSIVVENPAPVADGQWRHIVLVAERKGDATLHVDGAPGEPIPMKGLLDITNTRRTLRIGDRGHDDPLDGMMDEVRISTVARKVKN
ncbi:MAG: LamG domain-containing protein [Verrucomicrobia bacterium]|nr:LamG domain-containing protein [Verrucomicrobiota bacterium]